MNDEAGYPAREGPFELQLPDWFPKTRDTLRREYAEIWAWLQSNLSPTEADPFFGLGYLTSQQLAGATSNRECDRLVAQAAACLGITLPIQVFQTEGTTSELIRIYRAPDHVQLIFQAGLLSRFNEQERLAIIANELAKISLSTWDGGDLVTVEQFLRQFNLQKSCPPVFVETLRLFHLYSKVFCDRGAWKVCGDLGAVNASILLTETGDFPIRGEAASTRRGQNLTPQDNEVSLSQASTDAVARMYAAKSWRKQPAALDGDIVTRIQGPFSWKCLDVHRQSLARQMTRDLIATLLAPEWMRTAPAFAYAKLFFIDFEYREPDQKSLTDLLGKSAKDVQEFICFTMLDFVTAERSLLEPALAYTLQLAEQWKLKPLFIEIANRELRLRKSQIKEIANNAEQLMGGAAESHSKSVHRQDDGKPE